MICEVKVNNVPKTSARKYIVARYCVLDNGLWFHSAWDDATKARQVASEVEGVVCLNTNDIPEKTESEK